MKFLDALAQQFAGKPIESYRRIALEEALAMLAG